MVDAGHAAPVAEGRTARRWCWADAAEAAAGGERYFLGVGATACRYFAVAASAARPGGAVDSWADLREVGAALGDLDAGLLAHAVGARQWHDRHRFARCPARRPTWRTAAGSGATRTTGSEYFPRTDPAVIMLVHDGGDRVRARPAGGPGRRGRYSILAGFVEPGESAEAAVAREVARGGRVAVADVRYVGSQPWPFPQSLMLGFTALRGRRPTLSLDHGEIEDAPLVHPATSCAARARGALPPPVSIAYRIITDWIAAG